MYGFEAGFLDDWCTKALGTLGWGAPEQLALLAHMYSMMNPRWARAFFQHHGTGLLHPSIDMALVELSLGVRMHDLGFAIEPRLASLFTAIESVVQSRLDGEDWTPSAHCHPGVALRMDLMPGRDFLSVYSMGVAFKREALGQNEPIAVLELPALG